MSVLVVDASVAAKWFLDEVHSNESRRLLGPGYELHAPDFILLELDNVFCQRTRRGDLAEQDAESARALLQAAPLQLHAFLGLRDVAYQIACQLGRSVYDSLYAALAQSLRCRMATADRRFRNALGGHEMADLLLWVEDIL